MILLERVLVAFIPLAMILIGIVTFAITPYIVHEDDAIVRIGMRRAAEPDAIEFALFVEIKRLGPEAQLDIPAPNALVLAELDRSWDSGGVELLQPAPAIRLRGGARSGENFADDTGGLCQQPCCAF